MDFLPPSNDIKQKVVNILTYLKNKLKIMKKLFIPILFAFAILVQSNSCKKPKPTPVYNTEFQNNTGTWWKYKVYDSVYYQLDTVTINVLGNTKLNDGTDVSIWAIKSISTRRLTSSTLPKRSSSRNL